MADVHDKKTRSYNMSMIRGKNTKPEMIVRHFLFSKGYRYRINVKKLPGKPDIVLKKYKTVIFVNGCFWHGHVNCKGFRLPKSNTEWWRNKIDTTRKRDEKSYSVLKESGWNIIVIWDCQLHKTQRDNTLSNLNNQLIANLHS